MDNSLYALIIALLAVVYSLISRKIQYKFGNQKEMEALNKETKELNEEYKKAVARNDKKETERIMQKQMETMGKMWGGVAGQFKTLLPILGMFLLFSWGFGYFDPSIADDIAINLSDNGGWCDAHAGDGIYTGCYKLGSDHNSVWIADVKAYNADNVVGENFTAFVVGSGELVNVPARTQSGNAVPLVSTDKPKYATGDTIRVFAKLKEGNAAKAILNNGTWFHVDLPFYLPALNLTTWQLNWFNRINEPIVWFILISIILSLVLSFVIGKVPMLKEVLS